MVRSFLRALTAELIHAITDPREASTRPSRPRAWTAGCRSLPRTARCTVAAGTW